VSANDSPGLPPDSGWQGSFSPDTGTERAPGGDKTPAATGGELTVVQSAAGLEYARQLSKDEAPPTVPGYEPVRKLGEGTYGHVWLFTEDRTGVQVAIKFFPRGTGERWQCLQAEVKQLALLCDDPGIVQLKDVDPDAAPPYYVMTYAPGGSLAGRLEGGRTLPVPEALRLFREVAGALAYVHAKGVRHCDLKPGNVLLDARGRALVADFGQAHLGTDLSPSLGTFFYMAPEQADLTHAIPDTRWDVYGLGALFYAMVTGRPPREDAAMRDELASTAELGHRLRRYREGVRNGPPPTGHHRLPGMDRPLARIVDRCLDLDPDRRPHDAGAVLAHLDRRDRARRQRPLLAVGVLAPLLLLVGMAVAFIQLRKAAYDRSSEAVLGRLERNDATMAHLVANVLRLELDDCAEELKAYAADKALVGLLRGEKPDRTALEAHLRGLQFGHWFDKLNLADARGYRLAYASTDGTAPDATTWDKSMSWREWFNGKRHMQDKKGEYVSPLTEAHVSGPYAGKEDGQLLIGISCPVRDPADGGKILGVLVGAAKVEKLSEWLKGMELLDGNHGAFVVLNGKRQFLLHPLEASVRDKDRYAEPHAYRDVALYEALIGGRKSGSDTSHVDPLDGRTYVAGFAPVVSKECPDSGWGVVVQHDREVGLAPVEELRHSFTVSGLSALALTGTLISGLWAWLVWNLRREEAAAHA
jgi:hypothetical protein